ncbi:MAG: MarR family winged helix-turn-helix transcriptional regulator [Microbacteriaceae bacterium]
MPSTASDLLRRITLTMRNRGDSVTRQFGLSVQAGRTIGFIEGLEAQGRSVSQRDLAEISGTTPASITSLLQNMERDGWVVRQSDPVDARRKVITITAKARAMLRDWEQLWANDDTALLRPLTTQERREFLRLLEKVGAAYIDEAASASPSGAGD